jgi:cytochrome o ubiquinol oxidase subunit 2
MTLPRIARWPHFSRALVPLLILPLSGCNWVVMNPSGDVAIQQRDLIVISTALMLLIILPVMALTILFAWRYRKSAKNDDYDPEWSHSTSLELVIWSAPLLIIICLGAITWTSTHLLDPYRPIDRIHETRDVLKTEKRLQVQVVALDWKWLFIYPELGIATVNELAAPVDVPIDFKLTSAAVMNSFYIPALAGQIYTMPGMQTALHAVINKSGNYEGFSANYSGSGFSYMRFRFHAFDAAGFDRWVKDVKASGKALDRPTYLNLEKPSEKEPVQHFATVDAQLFQAILNLCPRPGQRCMTDVMAIDSRGGAGKESARETQGLHYDRQPEQKAAQNEVEELGSSSHPSMHHDLAPVGNNPAGHHDHGGMQHSHPDQTGSSKPAPSL